MEKVRHTILRHQIRLGVGHGGAKPRVVMIHDLTGSKLQMLRMEQCLQHSRKHD